MCRFPSPLTVAAVIGGYPHAPPEGPAMQRAGPAPGPVRPYAPWGTLAAIDLHGCESGRLEDADSIRAFVPAVIDAHRCVLRACPYLTWAILPLRELAGWRIRRSE